jgi:hypothetical protein
MAAKFGVASTACKQFREQFSDRCCDAQFNVPPQSPPTTPSPESQYARGPHAERSSLYSGFDFAGKGLQCVELLIHLADRYSHASAQCQEMKSKYQNRCCNANYNIAQNPIPPPPPITPDPILRYPRGPHPHCDLCRGGGYPGNPYMVSEILHIPGTFTCKDMY